MTASLEGRVAVVTGGCRGIGRAISHELAHLGADIVLLDLLEGPTVEEIRALGRKCRHFACDISKSSSIEEVVPKIKESFGLVHILVNNAGITRDQLALRMSEEDWDKVLDINLKGAFLCSKIFSRDMMKARWGRIINISSVSGQRGNIGQANYSAAKAGMVGLARSLARELASRGITVNVVAPGFIETAMTDAIGEKAREMLLPLIPMSRLGKCEDVGAAVGFFASNSAEYITGQVLNVDGGMVMS